MNVLMISLATGLLDQQELGDVVRRHQKYAKHVDRLDIYVLSKKRRAARVLADNCVVRPLYWWNAFVFVVRGRYDLIVAQDPFFAGILGLLRRLLWRSPLVVHCHGDFFGSPFWKQERRLNALLLPLGRFVLRCADAVRVVSEAVGQSVVAQGIMPSRVVVIPTPVDLSAYAGSYTPKTAPTATVVSVGRLVAAKDYPTLLRAAALVQQRIPTVRWEIVGDGPLAEPLRIASRQQSYVVWRGHVAHDALPNLYATADVVVLTSTNESFGMVLLEAGLVGRPVVATATAGAREIVLDGTTGVLVPIGDAAAIAQAVSDLLTNHQRAVVMGQRAHDHIMRTFDWQKNSDAVIALWKRLVS